MAIGDWFNRVLGRKRTARGRDGVAHDGAGARGEPSALIAEPAAPSLSPLAPLRGVPLVQAIPRAMELLEKVTAADAAMTLVSWLRDASTHDGVPPEVRMRLADFFSARGELDHASAALRPLCEGTDATASAAFARLADLADQRGDRAEVVRMYEEILAIDMDYAGIRERWERMRAPARAGAAGATLLSPEATRLAQGRLELVRELGRGGAGAVFLARDRRVMREVALKIYHPSSRSDRSARLRAESQVAAALASRHVVRVYDLIENLGALSMEYCAGGTLRTAISRGASPVQTRRTWSVGIAHALAVAHGRGWVHRDLKPGNVMFRADGAPVLTDFGLARKTGASVESFEGTAGFVAPEVAKRKVADPRGDVYAFGALLRELLGGADAVLGALTADALAEDPDKRPADGAALLERLRAVGLAVS